jgi:hypothetical protein
MSGNRIRYIEHPTRDNALLSLNSYTSQKTGAKYKIILDLENMQYMIRNERSKEVSFTSKKYVNLNVLKRTARAKLEDFGVSLKRESRDRTFGLCPEGYNQNTHEKEN